MESDMVMNTEAGYLVSQNLAWGVLAALAGLLLVCVWGVLRYRSAVNEHKQVAQNVRERADSFRYLVETAHEGIVVVQNRQLVYLNPRMCEMTGYTEAELKALPTFMPLIEPSARRVMLENHLRRLSGEPSPQRYESLFLKKDGTTYPIELSGVAIVWQGEPATLNMVTDISARKAAEQKLQYLAHHDSLTNLPNRYLLQERLTQGISLARQTRLPLAVLFIDLNDFKRVNDNYGHEAGDSLLQQIAERISPLLRGSDTLARMGGDEFVILLPQIDQPEEVDQTIARIEAAMAAPFQVHGHTLRCCFSLGAAVYPEDGTTPQALLSQADRRMYAYKRFSHQREAQLQD